jgi:hypothetical protein
MPPCDEEKYRGSKKFWNGQYFKFKSSNIILGGWRCFEPKNKNPSNEKSEALVNVAEQSILFCKVDRKKGK